MKRTISFVLCVLVLFGFSTIAVDAATTAEEAGDYLKKIGIYKGYEDGGLRLKNDITRAEFATLAVRVEGLEDLQKESKGQTRFEDVDANHWASGYINVAADNGLLVGDAGTDVFRPEDKITYAETVTVLIRLLEYEDTVAKDNWPENYMNKADELDILKNIDIPSDSPISRGEIAVLIFDSLGVEITK